MGVAYAVKSGDMQLSDVDAAYRDKVKELVDGMSLKDLKDFASTPHKGLPEVAENITPSNIGGMGDISFPTETEVGSGDIPKGRKSEEDEDEKEIKEMKTSFIPTFEAFFSESLITESDLNDPVLMAFRAAKMKREKELAKPKRKPLYGKERLKAEDDLWDISQDLKDLYSDRGQMLIDMEEEAEAEGGPIADEYGDQLNKIEDEIQKLIAKRNKLEMRLAESVVNEGKGAKNYFEDLKYNYTKSLRYLDNDEKKEYNKLAKDFFSKLAESVVNEAKFKAGDKWEWKHVDGNKTVEITDIKSNGDVVARVDGDSQEFILREPNKYLKKKVNESTEVNEARSINKIQKDWGKITSDMKVTVDAWKEAEGKDKDKLLAKLKDLTTQKKKLEAELDAAVSIKDVDAELAAESIVTESASQKLADEIAGELYTAKLKGKSATITATTTTQMWDDDVPVLKYLARGKAKPVKFELWQRPFDVVHDPVHGWFYFTDGRKWYGLHMDDGYYGPEDLPFDMTIK